MKTLALVPARSGSKGIPGKNIREFCGRPLLAWAVEVGRATCDRTIVSTDSDEYAAVAKRYGAEAIRRAPGLAADDTPMLAVVRHALAGLWLTEEWEPDVVVILQPTQPKRTVQHVVDALALLEDRKADSVVSVVEMPAHLSPDYVLTIGHSGQLWPHQAYRSEPYTLDAMVTRRQAADPSYYRDGTVYAVRTEVVDRHGLYGYRCIPLIIPAHESVTLDTEDDWQRAVSMVS